MFRWNALNVIQIRKIFSLITRFTSGLSKNAFNIPKPKLLRFIYNWVSRIPCLKAKSTSLLAKTVRHGSHSSRINHVQPTLTLGYTILPDVYVLVISLSNLSLSPFIPGETYGVNDLLPTSHHELCLAPCRVQVRRFIWSCLTVSSRNTKEFRKKLFRSGESFEFLHANPSLWKIMSPIKQHVGWPALLNLRLIAGELSKLQTFCDSQTCLIDTA